MKKEKTNLESLKSRIGGENEFVPIYLIFYHKFIIVIFLYFKNKDLIWVGLKNIGRSCCDHRFDSPPISLS